MKYRERKEFTAPKIFGFIALIVTAGIFCGFGMFAVSGRLDSMKANKILLNIDSMAKQAYREAKELDEMHMTVSKIDIEKNCSIVKSSGAWYMVCDLDGMTGGDKNEQKNVLKNFAKYKKHEKIIPPSDLSLKDFDPSKCIAVFIRFSS